MRLQRLGPWLLVAALLAAQMLALAHRVAHGADSAGPAVSFATEAHAGEPGERGPLDAGHAQEPSCLLFDAATQGGAAASPGIVLAAKLATSFIAWFQGEALARWAALFDARGPPSLR